MSIKERFWDIVKKVILVFIVVSVISKLFIKTENWLYHSIVWAIIWVMGDFVVELLEMWKKKKKEQQKVIPFNKNNNKTKEIIELILIIIVSAYFMLAFLLGVLLNIPDWDNIVNSIIVPFTISIIIKSLPKN